MRSNSKNNSPSHPGNTPDLQRAYISVGFGGFCKGDKPASEIAAVPGLQSC